MLHEDALISCPVLVFANKTDLPNSLSTQEITAQLNLHAIQTRSWAIFGSSFINGDGMYEGLDWLSNILGI